MKYLAKVQAIQEILVEKENGLVIENIDKSKFEHIKVFYVPVYLFHVVNIRSAELGIEYQIKYTREYHPYRHTPIKIVGITRKIEKEIILDLFNYVTFRWEYGLAEYLYPYYVNRFKKGDIVTQEYIDMEATISNTVINKGKFTPTVKSGLPGISIDLDSKLFNLRSTLDLNYEEF